jgi:hypothetical protein
MAAARIMLDGGVGLLRTLPAVNDAALRALRRASAELGHEWPAGQPYADWIRSLPASQPGASP